MTWTWVLACDIITLLSSLMWYLMEDQALKLFYYKNYFFCPQYQKIGNRQYNYWDLPKFRQKRKKPLNSLVCNYSEQCTFVSRAWWILPGFIILKVCRSFYPKPNIWIPLCGYWQEATPELGCSISSLSTGWNLDKLNYIWVILRPEWHDNIFFFFFFSSRQPWN